MAEDYYSMDDAEGAPKKDGGEGGDQHEEMEGESALLPKSILAGKEFNVGDEVVLEIVAMHDDEIEVKYAKDKGDGGGSKMEDGESEMSQAEGRLSSMAEGNNSGGGY